MTVRPDTTDPLDRIEALGTIQADGQDVPWVLLTVEQRDALVAVARAAREAKALLGSGFNNDTFDDKAFVVLRDALARLDGAR